jgi:O-antigen/teichoic acid export membrane protein
MSTRQIAHNTIIQFIGKGFSTLLGLAAIAMMTRYLGAEQFGWYVTAISFLQFIGILTDFGLIPVTAQMLSESRGDKKNLLQNLLGFRFVTALFFLGFAPLLVLLFPYPLIVKQAVAIMTVSFVAIAMNQIFTGYYQHKLKMIVQVGAEIVGRLTLVGGLWFLIAKNTPFLPIMTLITIASIAYLAIMWIGAAKDRPTLRFDLTVWKAIFEKSWPIAISVMFNVLYLKGDIVLLSLFRDAAEVGIYGAAYRVIDILAQTAMLLMGIMLPLLAYSWSRNKMKDFTLRFQQAFDGMLLFAAPMIVGIFLLAEPIMTFVAGTAFASSAVPLKILSLAVGGVYLGAIFGHVAVAINKQRQTMWVYISSAVLTLVGYLFFIPRFGMIGAAWMSVFSEIYVGVLLWIVVMKWIQSPLMFRATIKIFAATLGMALFLLIMPRAHVLLDALAGACVYAIILYASGGVSKETLKQIFSRNAAP